MKTFVAIAVIALAAGAWVSLNFNLDIRHFWKLWFPGLNFSNDIPPPPQSLTIEQQKKAEAYGAECVKSTGVAPESAVKLRKGDFSGTDDKTKCFAKCVLEKAGFMNAAGDVQEKTVVEKLSIDHDKSKVEATLKKCNQKGANPCDTAFKVYECFYNTKAGLV